MRDPNLQTWGLAEKIFHSFPGTSLMLSKPNFQGHIFCLNLITQLWHSFPVTPRFPMAAWTPAPKCIRSTGIFFFFFLKYRFCFLCSALRPSFEWAEVGDVCFHPIVSFVTVLGFSSQVLLMFYRQKIVWFMRFWKSMKLRVLNLDFGS